MRIRRRRRAAPCRFAERNEYERQQEHPRHLAKYVVERNRQRFLTDASADEPLREQQRVGWIWSRFDNASRQLPNRFVRAAIMRAECFTKSERLYARVVTEPRVHDRDA